MDLHVKVTDQLKEYIIPPTPENVCGVLRAESRLKIHIDR
jgi:hypothetical protein